MKSHRQYSDADFLTQFEAGSFPSSLFSHEAHLRLAYLHIKTYGIDRAVDVVGRQIFHYVERLGAEDKFHKTLTVAATRAVYHFMLRTSAHDFEGLLSEFPRLTSDFKALIETHYGFDILSSTQAKTQYVEPDLLPFD